MPVLGDCSEKRSVAELVVPANHGSFFSSTTMSGLREEMRDTADVGGTQKIYTGTKYDTDT